MKTFPLVLLCILGPTAFAAPLVYDGTLQDVAGKPIVNETKRLTLSVYDRPDGGEALFSRTCEVRTGASGLFHVVLDVPEGDFAAWSDRALYVGAWVDGAVGENRPLQLLRAVPYAHAAYRASSMLGDIAPSGPVEARSLIVSNGVSVAGRLQVGASVLSKGNLTVDGRLTAETAQYDAGLAVRGEATAKSVSAAHDMIVDGTLDVASVEVTGPRVETTEPELLVGGSSPVAPVGVIVMWYGDPDKDLPDGWVLCDGRNVAGYGKTPDLRGRFVVGAGATCGKTTAGDGGAAYLVGSSGGTDKVALTEKTMPAHAHDAVFRWSGYRAATRKPKNHEALSYYGDDGGKAVDLFDEWSLESCGKGEAHENMPAYLGVHFIMRIRREEGE